MVTQEMYNAGTKCRGICEICDKTSDCYQYKKDGIVAFIKLNGMTPRDICEHNGGIYFESDWVSSSLIIYPESLRYEIDKLDQNSNHSNSLIRTRVLGGYEGTQFGQEEVVDSLKYCIWHEINHPCGKLKVRDLCGMGVGEFELQNISDNDLFIAVQIYDKTDEYLVEKNCSIIIEGAGAGTKVSIKGADDKNYTMLYKWDLDSEDNVVSAYLFKQHSGCSVAGSLNPLGTSIAGEVNSNIYEVLDQIFNYKRLIAYINEDIIREAVWSEAQELLRKAMVEDASFLNSELLRLEEIKMNSDKH